MIRSGQSCSALFAMAPLAFGLSLLHAAAASAQNLGVEWGLNFSEENTQRGLFFGRDAADQPDFRPTVQMNRVLRTSNGSYVLVPSNSADLPDANALLAAPPAWPGTRGWQLLRLDDNAGVLWKRFIASPSARIDDIRLTAELGIALLQNNQAIVFAPDGSTRFQMDLATQACPEDFGRFSGNPDRQFINEEELIIVNYAGDVTEQARACAIDFNGNIVDRITAVVGRLEVGDYRRSVGFLTKEGPFFNGFWSDARIELRSQTATAWTLSGVDAEIMRREPQIALDRTTLIILNGRLRGISPLGVEQWDGEPGGFQSIGFLSPNRLLQSNPSSTALRAIASDGSVLWEVSQAPWTDSESPAFHQISASSFTASGYLRGTRNARVRSYSNASGVETRQINLIAPVDRPVLSVGALGDAAAVLINAGAAPLQITNPFAGSCSLIGFCPTSFGITSPSILRYSSTGQLSAELGGAGLNYPLPSRPLEHRPAVQQFSDGALLHLSYGHDGQRQVLVVRRISSGGQVLWSRRLSDVSFDLERASAAIVGNTVMVSAHIGAPGTAAGSGTLWQLDASTGSPAASFPTLKLQELHAVSATPAAACSLAPENVSSIVCMSPGQAPQQISISAPAGTGALQALGRSADGQLLARRIAAPQDRFALVRVNALGVASVDPELVFNTAGGTPARVDQLLQLPNGEFLASARSGTLSGSVVAAALFAQFAADGSRQWQQAVGEPQRPYQNTGASSLNTVLARASNGDAYLGIQLQDVDPLRAPVRVCRFSASGAAAGCVSAPRAGRIVALLPDPDSSDVLAVLRSHTGSTIDSQLATELHRVNASGFSASLLRIPEAVALSSQSILRSGDALYFSSGTLNNFGVYVDRPTGIAGLYKITLGSDLIFRNGFED
jgi:hypothetical protein